MLVALSVRVLALVLMLLADWLLEDYDTSAEFFPDICTDSAATSRSAGHHSSFGGYASTVRKLLTAPFQRLVLWDTVFFMDISCNGYSFEQQYAFFPMLPGA